MREGEHSQRYRIRPTIAGFMQGLDNKPTSALYRSIRLSLGLTQKAMARIMGINRDTLCHRECGKRKYTVGEIVGLYHISQLSPAKYLKLLEELADEGHVIMTNDEVTP